MEIEILTSLIWTLHVVNKTELTYSISHICTIKRKKFKLNSIPLTCTFPSHPNTHTTCTTSFSGGRVLAKEEREFACSD